MKSIENGMPSQEEITKIEKIIENKRVSPDEEAANFAMDKIEKEKLTEDRTNQEKKDEMAIKKVREALGIDVEELPDAENEDEEDSIEKTAENGDRLKEKFEAIKNEMIMQDAEMVEKNKEMLENLLNVVFEQGKTELVEGDLIEIVKNNKDEIGADQNGIEKFIQKDGMEKIFINGINNASTKEEAFENIVKSLENDFVPATENDSKMKIIEWKAIEQAKAELANDSRN